MSVVLGVDSSTQSVKIELRDADDGHLIHTTNAPHPATTPPRSEQGPDAWWTALSGLIGPHAPDIASISVAAQQHGMIVLDHDRRVLYPAKLWNDTESAPQAERLVADLGVQFWAEQTGSVPLAAFTITKLVWLAEHHPGVFERVAHVLLPHDWLTSQLTGDLTTDRGDASGTGYWSPITGQYSSRILDLVGLDASVAPTVLGPTTPAGKWGDVIVGPGTGDNMAAALGLGLSPGDVAISLGTSGTVFTVSDHPTTDTTGAVAGFADAAGSFLPLVCTLNATKVTDTVGRLLGVTSSELDTMALEAPAGAAGVVMVPYFDGERTPNLPKATGGLSGLRSTTDPSHIARAAFEGVICHILDALGELERVVPAARNGRLFLIGGGARSAAYRRVLADLTQRPVCIPPDPQYVARGACAQAAAVLRSCEVAQVTDAWSTQIPEIVEPDLAVDAHGIRTAYRMKAEEMQ
jgi:xylulokinase